MITSERYKAISKEVRKEKVQQILEDVLAAEDVNILNYHIHFGMTSTYEGDSIFPVSHDRNGTQTISLTIELNGGAKDDIVRR